MSDLEAELHALAAETAFSGVATCFTYLCVGSPVGPAWELARARPGTELVVVDDSGHTGSDTMRELALRATARFSARR